MDASRSYKRSRTFAFIFSYFLHCKWAVLFSSQGETPHRMWGFWRGGPSVNNLNTMNFPQIVSLSPKQPKWQASENLEKYQQETTKWRDKKIVKKDIAIGDWVLKRKSNAETSGKLQPKWEGPFLVIKSNRPGSYHLSDAEGNELQHLWNADSLKKYYI